MLLRTVAIVALIAMLATTLAQACAALGRARIHRSAQRAADDAFSSTLMAAQNDIAVAIQAGADPRTLTIAPTPAPSTCIAVGAAPCGFQVVAGITQTTAAPVGSAAEDATACQPQCADDLQENDAIAEGRIAITILVSVRNASGERYAVRERDALFRTFRVAPYAALVGTRDETDEAIAPGASAGDDAGTPQTVVNVRYVNANTGASTGADAWQSRGWNDGHVPTNGWDP